MTVLMNLQMCQLCISNKLELMVTKFIITGSKTSIYVLLSISSFAATNESEKTTRVKITKDLSCRTKLKSALAYTRYREKATAVILVLFHRRRHPPHQESHNTSHCRICYSQNINHELFPAIISITTIK